MSNDPRDRHSYTETDVSATDVSPAARHQARRPLFLGAVVGGLLGGVIALPIGMLAMALPTFRTSVATAITIAVLWTLGGIVVGLVIGVALSLFISSRSGGSAAARLHPEQTRREE